MVILAVLCVLAVDHERTASMRPRLSIALRLFLILINLVCVALCASFVMESFFLGFFGILFNVFSILANYLVIHFILIRMRLEKTEKQ